MMSLTKDEVCEMTGKKQRAAQAKALNALGVIYKARSDGSLLILLSHVEELFAIKKPAAKEVATWEPDWDVFATQQAEQARERRERKARRAAEKERINRERAKKGLRRSDSSNYEATFAGYRVRVHNACTLRRKLCHSNVTTSCVSPNLGQTQSQ